MFKKLNIDQSQTGGIYFIRSNADSIVPTLNNENQQPFRRTFVNNFGSMHL